MKKRLICMALAIFVMSQFTACGSEKPVEELGTIPTVNTIKLNGSSIEISGSGMSVEGNVVKISAPGSYTVSGTLDNGQIFVDVADETVETELILDNAHISNAEDSAIYIETGKDLKLKFKGENSLTSGNSALPVDENASGAALYSEDDMSIKGEDDAVLKVFGYINNGIATKNDLDFKGGNVVVLASNNGARGADSVEIKGGRLEITSGNDGIKATTTDKEGKGYISVENGEVIVNAKGDGIEAPASLNISGGIVRLFSEKDGVSCIGDVNISGGEVKISSASDAIQAGEANSGKGNVNISGGTVLLDACEEALKPRGVLNVSGGVLLALDGKDKSNEGSGFWQQSHMGAKGTEVSLSNDGAVCASVTSGYSFKAIIVGNTASGYSVSDGKTTIEVK